MKFTVVTFWHSSSILGAQSEKAYFLGVRQGFLPHLIMGGHRFGVVRGANDLVKINNRSRKQSHKRNGIRVGRIKSFHYLSTTVRTPSFTIE